MSNETVFGNQDNGSNVDGDAFTNNGQDNGSQLVGPGKKFKTIADLEKGKLEADAFIERLKTEKAELLAHAQAMEKIAKELQSGSGSGNASGTPAAKPSDVDLSEVVSRELDRRTAEQRRLDNLNSAVGTLVGIHGSTDEVRKVIATKAQELGLTVDALKNMAAESPKAFLNAIGAGSATKQATSTSTASTGTSSRPSTSGGGNGVKNQSYYQNLRKELGARFWDARVQNEMFKARQELGTKFYE